MSIKTIIQKVPVTIFKVLKSLVQTTDYQKIISDGFDKTITHNPLDMIIISASGIDLRTVSFAGEVQPQDMIGLVKGVSVVGFKISNDDKVVDENGVIYTVKKFDVAPANSLYTLLLRGIGS